MRVFEKQETPDHVYVIAFDTICQGWQTGNITDEENGPIPLYTKKEAELELQELKEFCEDDEYFMVHMDEYIDGRKTLVGIKDDRLVGVVIGDKPKKQE